MTRVGLGASQSAVLLLLVGALSSCDAPVLLIDSGISWELAEHRKETIRGLRYRITLDIPAARNEPILGRSLISFGWVDPDEQPLVIDFVNPGERVREVGVNGVATAWEAVNDHIVIPASALRAGAINEVDLVYEAGDAAFNRSDDFLYALFVPDRAHSSLPVFDQPNLKASVTWRVSVPGDWRVVANGPAAESTVLDDRATYEFLETRPIPTYLFAIAAGRFEVETEVIGERLVRMFHRETDSAKVARNRDELFRLHASALDWLEEYTGIEYPFQKFDFVLIPSFQYGGMEHPGGILYRQAGLMLDETATQAQILGRASVIAHETAHMWFGDLVTMNWFDDVWTKEVFANFMAAKIVSPSFPDVDHDLRFLTAHYPAAYGVDRTEGANPIRQPLDNLREAGTLYGAIIYQKAPVVMRQLEARVGEEVFRDGLREYLSTFAYGNATWPDLISILDERSEDDLAAWSRVWVEEPGRPTITVSRNGSGVVLRQDDPAGAGRVWPQRLGVRVGSVDDDRIVAVEMNGGETTIPDVGQAAFILPNGTGSEYGLFVLDEASLDYLLANVGGLAEGVARGATWVTLWDQVLEGRVTPTDFLEVAITALRGEEDELILGRLLGYVRTTFWRLLSQDTRAQYADCLERVLWEETNSDRPRTARAAFFAAYRRTASSDTAMERLRALWSGDETLDGLPLSEVDRTALATALALREVDDAEEILDAQEARISNPDRLARFRFVRPSLSADPAERDAFFAQLSDPVNREREPWVLAGLANLHHPLRAGASMHLIRPALDMTEEIQRTGDIFFPGRWLGATLGGHSSAEAAAIVEVFLADTPTLPPRLRLKVLQAADMVKRAASIVEGS